MATADRRRGTRRTVGWLEAPDGIGWSISAHQQPAGADGLFGTVKHGFSVPSVRKAPRQGPTDPRFDPCGAPPLSHPGWSPGRPVTRVTIKGDTL